MLSPLKNVTTRVGCIFGTILGTIARFVVVGKLKPLHFVGYFVAQTLGATTAALICRGFSEGTNGFHNAKAGVDILPSYDFSDTDTGKGKLELIQWICIGCPKKKTSSVP